VLDKNFAKYVNTVEEDNTGGISTSKSPYLIALTEWEDAWKEFLAKKK
jgi:hypothetical protein